MNNREKITKTAVFDVLNELNENLARLHFKEKKPCIIDAFIFGNYKEYETYDIYELRCSKYQTCVECICKWLNEEAR